MKTTSDPKSEVHEVTQTQTGHNKQVLKNSEVVGFFPVLPTADLIGHFAQNSRFLILFGLTLFVAYFLA